MTLDMIWLLSFSIFGRPFVKRFALYAIIPLSCL